MSGDESRRLRQSSVTDDDHHEEPPTTSRRRRGDGHDDDDMQSPTKENIDYDQFLKVQMNKWTQEALINVGCRLKYISNIEDILRKEGKHADFMASCFKQFGQFPTNWLFSAQIVHNLLLREIQIDGASESELWFSVWAMEVVDKLIDGFGMRLQDTLPRMRCWTMHKRPRNFMQTILDLEASIHSEKADVKEVLEATDDEAQADYP
ncbi:hypothetical protein Ddye_016670 [Dipteronia dyeriana]|uniref:Uncharacterized protein n=1 Tax=Dipteronia dyeriana TaxID=168575 RepID=A0AAD9U774_9ROSI|nr:hypothetical protein Ddye_016670 [Dipteronia dyeriana]